MKKIHIDRLTQLAEHLEAGCPGGHQVFDITLWNDGHCVCGTAGDAWGEAPIVWPDTFAYGAHGSIDCIDDTIESNYIDSGRMLFLGLTDEEDEHLFYADSQNPTRFGGEPLYISATREEVAYNIREFIKIKVAHLEP